MYELRPLRIGSDPEFLFGRRVDLDFVPVPASQIFGPNKAVTTKAFIGTDGHAATGEFRPSPARSVKRHLFDLACAIVTSWDFTRRRRRFSDVELIALPTVSGETAGGHIHFSMVTNDPLWCCCVKRNVYYSPTNGWVPLQQSQPAEPPPEQREAERLMHRGELTKAFFLSGWGQGMNYLLLPLENFIQPWTLRVARNSSYGGPLSPDLVRLGVSPRPDVPNGWGYAHLEYRLPSTWLIHPWLAYAYLAAAKLTMANWEAVAALTWEAELARKRRPKKKTGPPPGEQEYDTDDVLDMDDNEEGAYSPTPPGPPSSDSLPRNNAGWGELLHSRLENAASWRWPRDTADLVFAIDFCARHRGRWFGADRGVVDVQAWRRLAG